VNRRLVLRSEDDLYSIFLEKIKQWSYDEIEIFIAICIYRVYEKYWHFSRFIIY
jgi:hypothetical protein